MPIWNEPDEWMMPDDTALPPVPSWPRGADKRMRDELARKQRMRQDAMHEFSDSSGVSSISNRDAMRMLDMRDKAARQKFSDRDEPYDPYSSFPLPPPDDRGPSPIVRALQSGPERPSGLSVNPENAGFARDGAEPVDAPPERPVDMLRGPDDGMTPVSRRTIPGASRTPTLKERMMISQSRAAADKDQERAAGAAGLAVGMRGMPNQSSGFLDIDPTDPTRLLPEREQDTINMGRADRAIRGEDMRDQNVDSVWSAGGRKYPTLSMEELQRYVAEKKAKEGKQIGELDVAGAKERLKDRMANPRMERRSGPMEAKLQQQYKEKRDARQARDAYGNAAKMTASSNPRRQRAGQALLDAIQSGPGGGGQDGSGMTANSIAREGMHAARAAALAGASVAGQRAAYETAVRAAMNNQEFVQQRQRDESKREFDAGENRLNRESEFAKTDRLASATEGKSDAASRAMSDPGIRAFKIQEANPGMGRRDAYEQAKREIEEERMASGGSLMPGLPADTGPLSELDREKSLKAARDEAAKKKKQSERDAREAAGLRSQRRYHEMTPEQQAKEDQRRIDEGRASIFVGGF